VSTQETAFEPSAVASSLAPQAVSSTPASASAVGTARALTERRDRTLPRCRRNREESDMGEPFSLISYGGGTARLPHRIPAHSPRSRLSTELYTEPVFVLRNVRQKLLRRNISR